MNGILIRKPKQRLFSSKDGLFNWAVGDLCGVEETVIGGEAVERTETRCLWVWIFRPPMLAAGLREERGFRRGSDEVMGLTIS